MLSQINKFHFPVFEHFHDPGVIGRQKSDVTTFFEGNTKKNLGKTKTRWENKQKHMEEQKAHENAKTPTEKAKKQTKRISYKKNNKTRKNKK